MEVEETSDGEVESQKDSLDEEAAMIRGRVDGIRSQKRIIVEAKREKLLWRFVEGKWNLDRKVESKSLDGEVRTGRSELEGQNWKVKVDG